MPNVRKLPTVRDTGSITPARRDPTRRYSMANSAKITRPYICPLILLLVVVLIEADDDDNYGVCCAFSFSSAAAAVVAGVAAVVAALTVCDKHTNCRQVSSEQ